MRSATGRLSLRSKTHGAASLYFLFGTLYHAEGPAGEGQLALDEVLGWEDAVEEFDPQARLPTRETIGEDAPAGEEEPDAYTLQVRRMRDLRRRAIVFLVLLALAIGLMLLVFTRR
jgi:hypothetical protein